MQQVNFIEGRNNVHLKVRNSILLVFLFLACLLVQPSLTNPSENPDGSCSGCHGSAVENFKQPNVASVDRNRCYQCHNQGLHTRDYNGTLFRVYYTDPSGATKTAYFVKDPNTVTSTQLHEFHSTPDPRASSCTKCHISYSCNSCHEVVPHGDHSSTVYPKQTVWMTSGVFGGEGNYVNSCTTSNCHGTFTQPYKPVIINPDNTSLCYNCHAGGDQGHTEQQLATKHSTTFNTALIQNPNNEPINCTNCHSSELRTEHKNNSSDCNACHGTTTPSTVKDVIKLAKGIEANRACEKCHFNIGVLPDRDMNHPLDHSADLSNGVNVVGGPHATCNTCHERTAVQGIIKSLAYSSPKEYSCFACHTGGDNPKVPLHQADFNGQAMAIMDVHTSCAVCHTPGSSYEGKVKVIAERMKANPTGGYSCTECHDGTSAGHKATFNGVNERDTTVFHLKCTDCHNETYKTTVAYLKGQVKLGVAYDCAACHSAANIKGVSPYSPVHMAENDEVVGFHPSSCGSCHKVYNGRYNINLDSIRSKLPSPGYACADCHNGTVTASGLVANKPFHKATDAQGTEYLTTSFHPTCGTCHDTTHADARAVINTQSGTQTPYQCAACHTGGLEPLHNAKWTNGVGYDSTRFHKDCAQCHSNSNPAVATKIHALNTGLNSGSITNYNCTECHNNTVVPAAKHEAKLNATSASYETTVYHAKLTPQASESCFQCHNSELVASDMTTIFNKVKGGSGYLCTDCHNNGATAPYTPSHSAVLDTEAFDTLTLHSACTTCHTTVADTKIRTLKGQTSYDCQVCHGDVSAKHVSPTALSGGMINCSWCHTSDLVGTHLTPPVTLAKEMQCTTCHGSASPVKTQVQAGEKECLKCHDGTTIDGIHPGAQYVPRHLAVFPEFLPEYSPNCVSCHYNGSLGSTPTIDSLHSKYLVGCGECHNDVTFKPAVTALSTNCSGCHAATVKPTMDMTAAHTLFHKADTVKYPASAGCLECHAKDTTVEGQNLLGVHKKKATSTVTCDNCHGATARQAVKDAVAANNISCQACHATTSGHLHPVAMNTYTATPDVNCSKCHATASNGTAELAAVHADAAERGKIREYSCATCHNAAFEGSVIPRDGALDMLNNNKPIYCTDCHNGVLVNAPGTDYPEHNGTHKPAVDFGNYSWEKGVDCSNCHRNMNIAPVHDSAIPQDVSCNSCHASDNPEVLDVIQANWSRAASSQNFTCADCHNTLASSKHSYEHKATSKENVTCNTCHDGVTVVGAFNAPSGVAVDISNIHSSNNCNTCHASANPTVQSIISSRVGQNNSIYNCEGCHDAITPKHNKLHTVISNGCNSCHPTDVVSVHNGKTSDGRILNCDTCHGRNVDSIMPTARAVIISNLSSNPNRTGYTCDQCHTNVQHQRQGTTPGNGKGNGKK